MRAETTTGPIGVSSPIRPRVFAIWLVGLAAVVVVAGLTIQGAGGATGAANEGPDAAQLARMRSIDALVAAGDCPAIRAQTDRVARDLGVPGTEQHSRDTMLIEYADEAMQRLGCRPSTAIESGVTGPFAGTSRTARF